MITMTSLSLLASAAGTSLALPPLSPMTLPTASPVAEVRVVNLDPPQPEDAPRVVVRTNFVSDSQPEVIVETLPGSSGGVYQFSQQDDDETFVIKIENNKVVELKRNGHEITGDHFTFDDGEITIVDDDGNVITTHNIHRFGADAATPPGAPRVLRFGQGGNFVFDGTNNNQFFTDNSGNQVTWDFQPKVMVGINQGVPSAALRYHLGLGADQPCILIEKVIEGLPADQAGLHQYDVVITADGKKADDGVLRELLADKEPGANLVVEVIRKGKPMQLKIELQAYDSDKLMPNVRLFGTDDQNDLTFSLPSGGEWIVAPGTRNLTTAPTAPAAPGALPTRNFSEFNFRTEDFSDPDKARETILKLREGIQQHADRVQLDGDRLMILRDAEQMHAEALRMAQEARAKVDQATKVASEKIRRDVMPQAADRMEQIERRLDSLEGTLNDRLETLFDRLDSISDQLKDRLSDSDKDEI